MIIVANGRPHVLCQQPFSALRAVWFEEAIYYDEVISAFKAAHADIAPLTSAGSDHFQNLAKLTMQTF